MYTTAALQGGFRPFAAEGSPAGLNPLLAQRDKLENSGKDILRRISMHHLWSAQKLRSVREDPNGYFNLGACYLIDSTRRQLLNAKRGQITRIRNNLKALRNAPSIRAHWEKISKYLKWMRLPPPRTSANYNSLMNNVSRYMPGPELALLPDALPSLPSRRGNHADFPEFIGPMDNPGAHGGPRFGPSQAPAAAPPPAPARRPPRRARAAAAPRRAVAQKAPRKNVGMKSPVAAALAYRHAVPSRVVRGDDGINYPVFDQGN